MALPIKVTVGTGGKRNFEMDGLDVEMVPMWLARIQANYVKVGSSTTVVTKAQNWYLGSGLMDGGRNHATDQ
jgi:hypothetical protein